MQPLSLILLCFRNSSYSPDPIKKMAERLLPNHQPLLKLACAPPPARRPTGV